MPRDDETPTAPHVSERLAEIAERVRRRSTRTTEIAQLAAMEALAVLDLDPHKDPRVDRLALLFRGYLEKAVDAATTAISGELARVGTEADARRARILDLEAQIDRLEDERGRLKAALRADLRGRSDGR
jgi:chromosome segregation ATPase